MNRRQTRVRDLVVSKRVMDACWLLASLGIATLQMRLLAQAWHQSGTALESAVAASCWLLGALIGSLRRDGARGYGVGVVGVVLAWLFTPAVAWNIAPALQPTATGVGLLACACSMGWVSTAWLSGRRPWPPVGERVGLARALVGGTVGLVLVWLLPGALWSGVVGLAALFPLLFLDVWPQSCSPLPERGGLVDSWTSRAVTRSAGGAAGLRLDRGTLPSGWWMRYLAARGRLGLTLLASLYAIVLGTVWGTIPTPFAAALASRGQPETLAWILGGQLCALLLGLIWLASSTGRGGVGRADRLLPETWRPRARAVSLVLLLVMAGSLLAVGLPFLQDPWSLAASLGSYTLAAMFWVLLLPRLRPSISTITQAYRHSYLQPAVSRLLPLRQGEEDLVNRKVMIAEALVTVIAIPGVGAFVDLFSVDTLLIIVGCVLIACLAVAAGAISGMGYQAHPQLERWYGGHSQRPGQDLLLARMGAGDDGPPPPG